MCSHLKRSNVRIKIFGSLQIKRRNPLRSSSSRFQTHKSNSLRLLGVLSQYHIRSLQFLDVEITSVVFRSLPSYKKLVSRAACWTQLAMVGAVKGKWAASVVWQENSVLAPSLPKVSRAIMRTLSFTLRECPTTATTQTYEELRMDPSDHYIFHNNIRVQLLFASLITTTLHVSYWLQFDAFWITPTWLWIWNVPKSHLLGKRGNCIYI